MALTQLTEEDIRSEWLSTTPTATGDDADATDASDEPTDADDDAADADEADDDATDS